MAIDSNVIPSKKLGNWLTQLSALLNEPTGSKAVLNAQPGNTDDSLETYLAEIDAIAQKLSEADFDIRLPMTKDTGLLGM